MILFAGPCAAESAEQLLSTARLLPGQCIFRAGIWKPRTRPDSFQGVGEEGLAWLRRVKEEAGLLVSTEVASPEHIRLAVAAGVDYLWLGARTTANPILVQQLADALREQHEGVKAVLVKNPVNEDAALWLGDIARMEQTGLPVMAVHRGCGHRPCWAMAHALRTARPDIPLLLDPSHLSGDAQRIPALVEKAACLGFDGLMVEVHPHPEVALSDAAQQLTPAAFANLLPVFLPQQADELAWLRAEMDEIDDQLWTTIRNRMALSRRIGGWKKEHRVATLQPARFAQMLESRLLWAQQNGVPEETVRALMQVIHDESCKQQS